RPRARSLRSRRVVRVLDEGLVRDLRSAGGRLGASLFVTLLSTFSSLLGRISGQDDFVVGIMAAGQSAAAIPGLVGHCANMLPIRSCTKAGETFEDLVSRMRARVLDAHEHQWLSFGRILGLLSLRRDPGRLPLVSVVFNLDQGVSQAPTFRGLGA